nr:immunoglobulin heavy chain junction region [Homo sapiens]
PGLHRTVCLLLGHLC